MTKPQQKIMVEGQSVIQKLAEDETNRDWYLIDDQSSAVNLVIFGGLANQIGMPVFEFKKALAGLAVNILFIRDFTRSWYHLPDDDFGDDFETRAKRIQTKINQMSGKRTIFIGSSAGGYAALAFAALIPCESVLVFGPQVFIDPDTRRTVSDNRWPKLMQKIPPGPYLNISHFGSRIKAGIHIIAGTGDSLDMVHALYAKAAVGARVYTLSGAGHNPARQLRNAGVLDKIISEVVNAGTVPVFEKLHIAQRLARLKELI